MLFTSAFTALVGALSLSSAVAASPTVSHELAQKRGVSFNAPHYSLYLYGKSTGLLVVLPAQLLTV